MKAKRALALVPISRTSRISSVIATPKIPSLRGCRGEPLRTRHFSSAFVRGRFEIGLRVVGHRGWVRRRHFSKPCQGPRCRCQPVLRGSGARRRRGGASRLISPASRCFSHQARPTSSPAPRFPLMADFRSWAKFWKRASFAPTFTHEKSPGRCRGFCYLNCPEDQYFATSGAAPKR
jgi:hypothetical protein